MIESSSESKTGRNLRRCKMLRLEDFIKDREKAKNWAKEKSEKWKKSLGLEEKRLLEDSVSFQRVNDTLEKNRGRYIKISSIRKNVDRLDKSLEVREACKCLFRGPVDQHAKPF